MSRTNLKSAAAGALGVLPPDGDAQTLLARLDAWVDSGALRALDRAFARFLWQRHPEADPLALLAAVFASHQLGRGHVCVDLRAVLRDGAASLALLAGDEAVQGEGASAIGSSALLAGVDLAHWTAAIDVAGFVDVDNAMRGAAQEGTAPLVRSGDRLYLRRYWQYEQSVRAQIERRVATPSAAASPGAAGAFAQALDALFSRQPDAPADWQKMACALVARQGFGIVTGGPGTGKTTTVVRLLALLQHVALSTGDGRRLRIRLAAPTGKAAARLSESISGAVSRLPLEGLTTATPLRAAIPTAVSTVHRLLGSRPDSRHFRHNARQRLPIDVLVLDEASMLDLEMVAAVMAALPPRAQLILLGDKDQLASVEAGAVLGDLCQRADAGHYLPRTARWLAEATGETVDAALMDPDGRALDQAVAKLRISYRFTEDSGIGRLAEAANRGDAAGVRRTFGEAYPDLSWLPPDDEQALRRLVVEGAPASFAAPTAPAADALAPVGYRRYLALILSERPALGAVQADFDRWALQVLRRHADFQLLCAVRGGPMGVEALNQRITGLLRAEGLLEEGGAEWYAGRPVMVTHNDHVLGLMNGDVGIVLPARVQPQDQAAPQWGLRVVFPAADRQGGVRWVMPSRLTNVETVFAMTVHKSQGSEFTHAALVLPLQPSRVLTRELVYTGVTRARRWFTLIASPAIVDMAVSRRVERTSGLAG